MVKISASLLSARDNLEKTIEEINNLDIDYIHLDIMDGKFVPNTSFTYEEIKTIVSSINKPLDVHLMVKDIDEYIYNYAMLNTEYITFHYETIHSLKTIKKIKDYGIKCGIAIKPNTNIEEIYDLLPYIDLVLVMSVEPGKGGQKFIDGSQDKIKKLKDKIKSLDLHVVVSVDGGINDTTAELCKASGVDILVIGSALTNSDNKREFVNNVK